MELPYAIRTNPYDSKDLVHGLEQAFSIDDIEKKLRMERLFDVVNHYDIDDWGKTFIHELEKVHTEETEIAM